MATVAAAKVFENVVIKKKKLRQSKNRKKSWRKHIDLTDIEIALDEKEEDERLGVLGEDSSNLFTLDTGDPEQDATMEDSSTPLAPVKLEYTLDTGTGLKATGRPKKEKLLYAHRLLAGLPGAKPMVRSRFRMQHTLEHELARRQSHRTGKRNVQKALARAEINKFSLKLSKTQKKGVQKLSFDTNIWTKPISTRITEFTAGSIYHANHTMGKNYTVKRPTSNRPKKIPATMIPHPGLSYNPSLESHQQLLSKALGREETRVAYKAKEKKARTVDFPKGALPSDEANLIADMNSEYRKSKKQVQTIVDSGDERAEAADQLNKVLTKNRITHQQRLRQLRYKKQLRDDQESKLKRKRENEVHKIDEFYKHIDITKADLKTRAAHRHQISVLKKRIPPRFYEEPDVEVALGDELRGSVRTLEPSSNPITNSINHIYRRGRLGSKPKDRDYTRTVVPRPVKVKKAKAVDPFTEESMENMPTEGKE